MLYPETIANLHTPAKCYIQKPQPTSTLLLNVTATLYSQLPLNVTFRNDSQCLLSCSMLRPQTIADLYSHVECYIKTLYVTSTLLLNVTSKTIADLTVLLSVISRNDR